MPEAHPEKNALERFFAGDLPQPESHSIVRHLISGCESCRQTCHELWQSQIALRGDGEERAPSLEGLLDAVLDKLQACQEAIDEERRAAGALFEELRRHPPGRRLMMVRNSPRFQTFALCEHALNEAYGSGLKEPHRAVALAELGVAISEELDAEVYGEPLRRDLQARSWAFLGNALRIRSDLSDAEKAFRRAEELLVEGTGDIVEEAQIIRLKGYLRWAQRRCEEALRLYDRAAQLFRRAGDPHEVGKTLVDRGPALRYMGRLEEAIAAVEKGLAKLDPEREPRALLVAKHNLVLFLHESGRRDEAFAMLREGRELHHALANEVDLARLLWLEGKLHRAEGQLDEAEAAFARVIDVFVAKKMPYAAATAAMDLSGLYLGAGRLASMKHLVAEILPIFRSLGIHREALAGLAMLQTATEQERVTMGLITELAQYLQQARHDPTLRFRPPQPA